MRLRCHKRRKYAWARGGRRVDAWKFSGFEACVLRSLTATVLDWRLGVVVQRFKWYLLAEAMGEQPRWEWGHGEDNAIFAGRVRREV